MENTHEDTYLIDTQEQKREDAEYEQEELFEDTNENTITEEELGKTHLDLNRKFPSQTMN